MSQQKPPQELAFRKALFRLAGYSEHETIPDGYDCFDAVDDIGDRINDLEAQVEAAQGGGPSEDTAEEALDLARKALTVADQHATDAEDMTKQRYAAVQARNYLVKQFDTPGEVGDQTQVTLTKIKELCQPRYEPYHQTVKRACENDLQEKWPAFNVTTNADGDKVCRCNYEDVNDELVTIVEHDLSRDGLTNRFVSEARRRGWS